MFRKQKLLHVSAQWLIFAVEMQTYVPLKLLIINKISRDADKNFPGNINLQKKVFW